MGHQTPFEHQAIQQFGDGGDLIGLAIDPALAQHQPLLARPRADQMQRRLVAPAVEGSPHRLAVDSDDLPLDGPGKRARPRQEAGLEGVRVNEQEDPPEGVMRGNTMGQGQELLQPSELAAAVQGDIFPALGAGDHGAHGNHYNIQESVFDLAGTAGIHDPGEMLN